MIATSLVLVAVFVPVAFFPGTTGILFRQFALTIAFSISISAFNALTLTPALVGTFAGRPHGEKNFVFKASTAILAKVTEGYRGIAAQISASFAGSQCILFFAGLGLTAFVFQRVPKGFVPNEDQGYFIIAIQAPTGASLSYTKKIGEQVNKILEKVPEAEGTFAVSGFSFGGSAPNRAITFVPLKPYSQRQGEAHNADAIVERIRGQLLGIGGAIVIPFLPPAVQGLGQFGGFQFEVQDQGGHTLQQLDDVTQSMIRAGKPAERKRSHRPVHHL